MKKWLSAKEQKKQEKRQIKVAGRARSEESGKEIRLSKRDAEGKAKLKKIDGSKNGT